MERNYLAFFLCIIWAGVCPRIATGAVADNALAIQARDLLVQRCGKCHGEFGGSHTKQMLLDRTAMVRVQKIVDLNHPEESVLLTRVKDSSDPMPPAKAGLPLSKEEVDLLVRWIKAGAPDWKLVPLPLLELVTTDQVLAAVMGDVQNTRPIDRPFLRYFTLTHLVNAKASLEELTAHQTALSKLINSLSWAPTIHRPVPLGPGGSVFRIDLRHYKWSPETWQNITTNYPYALAYRQKNFASLRTLLNCEIPFVRADWFIAHAAVPPLYEAILGINYPTNALARLEREKLQIDTTNNLATSPGVQVWRSGFIESGVSENNRIVERHESPYGAYWKSYDFKGNTGFRDIIRYPKSFRHDGGEMIFNLPNGLQAYLLVDKRGERLTNAPIEIVRDLQGISPQVSNGLSCMGCHSEGMKDFRSRAGQVRESILTRRHSEDYYPELLALYAEAETINRLVENDRVRFVNAVFLTGAAAGGREPILRLVEKFTSSLDLDRAAAELGVQSDVLTNAIQTDEALRASSMRLLTLTNGTLKRDLFEKLFSRATVQLDLGVNPADEAKLQQLLEQARLGNLDAYGALGLVHAAGRGVKMDFPAALKYWKFAAKKNHLASCLLLARFLATTDIDRLRDGPLALEFAQQAAALTQYNDAYGLDTLAAAYAEVGKFTEAVHWQTRAVELVGLGPNHEAFNHKLSRYREFKPLRIPWENLLSH